MRAIYFDGTKASFETDRAIPEAGIDESLIKVDLAALCNTDREVMRGYSPGFAGVMGHEFVGTVMRSSDTELEGKRVVGEINLSCFSDDCLYCATGRDHHCESRTTLGIVDKDGCFADYITLPTRLVHTIPDDMVDEVALFTEPLAAAIRIIEQTPLVVDLPVALVGDGRLAYMIAQVVALTHASLTVYGKDRDKLEMFAPFARTILVDQIDWDGEHDTYEVVIDATGNPESLASSIALTRSEGFLIMKSTYADKAQIDMSEVVVRELTIRGSRCGPFAPALDLLERGLITLPPVEIFLPQDFEKAFASQAFKVALDF
ncbi:MAG: alcohol dehydrogenase catalytic domain-containing protein [Coriobacteriia bacterium]|nr:alcohol dehydrogenase catalytic domain-containing protein [Coriobacteriia bacterium]